MKRALFLILCFSLLPIALFGGYSQASGSWSPERYIPTCSVQEHYDFGYQALYENHWEEALTNFMVILYHFPESPFYADATFYLGICYYFKGDFDLANRQFDRYLNTSGKLKHFEKVFEFKYYIAEHFSQGKRKHLFGLSGMPRWGSAKGVAIEIYDEVVAALPGKEIAARALFAKSEMLLRQKEYRESIECLQTIIRRFPKHTLAADSFVRISEIYYTQSRKESQNPDLISLAKVNLIKFGKNFPGDDRTAEAEQNLLAMQEVYAKSLYDTGRFYERKKKPHASAIYYQDAVSKYPGTEAAQKSQQRLDRVLAQV